MSSMSTLSIGTAASTKDATSPRTYSIGSKTSTLLRWEQRTSAVFEQYLVYTMGRREATKSNPIRRVTIKLSIPVVHSISSLDTVVGSIDADVSIRVPALATSAEVAAAIIQFQNLLLQDNVTESCKGDFPY